MDDEKIIALYWLRDESAIAETRQKYGALCRSIALRILGDRSEAEECEQDVYLDAWQGMPPARPAVLSAYLSTVTRRRALDRWRHGHAEKRGGGTVTASLDELSECLPDGEDVAKAAEALELAEHLSAFLRSLPPLEASVFLRRYWFFDSVGEICRRYGLGKSQVKMMLLRTRKKLSAYLFERGIEV